MPELPDLTVYAEALQARVRHEVLEGVRLANPFLLRSASPPISAVAGARVRDVRRVGKRLVFALDPDLYLVLHLMIAGRLHWKPVARAGITGKHSLAAFDFGPRGTLILTEAGSKRRASLHLVQGNTALADLTNRGGVDFETATLAEFQDALLRESHTIKRALTDQHLVQGLGNAYSDEALHAARLSPVRLTRTLTDSEIARLFDATRATVSDWTARVRADAALTGGFPEKVTAFRDGMAVHGRFGKPCPVCATSVQRIVHAENECNYCPTCQTGGKLLADRALSRLLKGDWPRTVEELDRKRHA